MIHHSELSALYGLHCWSKSFVLMFLFSTTHAKAFTFGQALDFQIKLTGIKGTELIEKKDSIKEGASSSILRTILTVMRTKLSC